MHKAIENKVIAITGGAQGIGLATAIKLTQEGARVSIGDIDSEKAALVAKQHGFHAETLDVRDRGSFANFIANTEHALGPVDILINNAGIMPMSAFEEEEDGITDAQIGINLTGVITGMKLVLPAMKQRNAGQIVNIASIAGVLSIPGAAVYSATKFAVMGLSDSVRQELRDTGIQISTVLPSKVLTDLSSGTDGAKIPAVTPEEVADAVYHVIRKQQDSVTVPNYLWALPGVYGALPKGLQRVFREALNDTQILKQLNQTARQGYTNKLQSLIKKAKAG